MGLISDLKTINKIIRDGHEAFENLTRLQNERTRQICRENDWYCYGDRDVLYNEYFYSDGTLHQDPFTKRTYPKGMYTCTSHGKRADRSNAGPNDRWPPDKWYPK